MFFKAGRGTVASEWFLPTFQVEGFESGYFWDTATHEERAIWETFEVCILSVTFHLFWTLRNDSF